MSSSKKWVVLLVVLALAITATLAINDRRGNDAAPSPPIKPVTMPALSESESELLQKGLAAHTAGNLEEAAAIYTGLLNSGASVYANYNLGVIAQTEGKVADAVTNYREALKRDPDYPAALFNLATLLSSSPEGIDEAIRVYGHLLVVQPENAPAHMNLGLLLAQVGETEAAETHLSRAMSLDPGLIPPADAN